MRRTLAAIVAVVATLLTLTGCQQGTLSTTGEPLTVEQADLLAQTRFQVANRGEVVLEISALPDDDVSHLDLTVTLDPSEHLAWGTMERGPKGIAVTETVAFTPQLFATEESGSWRTVEFDAGPNRGLAVVFALGIDRPENAQLLRQSAATYLGDVDVDGETQSVFRVPGDDGASGFTRLWLDSDGRLRRLDTGDDETLVILLTDAEPQPKPDGVEGEADG